MAVNKSLSRRLGVVMANRAICYMSLFVTYDET